ncbi:putative mitogen-activated protein kinase kinase, partial [Colletotrichum sublineola]
ANIISLEVFDGRLPAIYVHCLPGSLSRGEETPFALHEARRILRNVTSTLAYLTTRRIVHNDIKPADIPSSPENGAILLDFGLATASDAPVKLDGTPLGAPGHVWALAITMLYVCEKTKMPEHTSKDWLIRDVVDKSIGARLQMMKWLEAVGQERERLQSADVVEDLVYKMLDLIATSRIDAV